MRLPFRLRSGSLILLLVLAVTADASAQEKTEAATRLYNAAVGLHNSEAYDLAAKEWYKFTQDHPNDPRVARAYHYLGACYSNLGQFDNAVKTYNVVLAKYPEFELMEETLLNLGLSQYNLAQQGNAAAFDDAAKTFNTLATKYPKGKHIVEALFYEGESLYNRGKKKEAAPKYAMVVSDYPNHALAADATFALGVTQAELNLYPAAVKSYTDFLAKFPNHKLAAEVTMWLGESQFALKQYAEAIKSFTTAADTAGFALADHATLRKADAQTALKQYAEAAATYASVPAKFPQSAYAETCELEAGKKYYLADDNAKALTSLNKVIAAGGANASEAAHWAARCLLKQNKPADALKTVEQVLPKTADGPDKIALLLDQADAIYEIPQRRGESVGLYHDLATKYPDHADAPQALYMAAFAALGQQDYKTALAYAKAFTAAYAENPLAVGAQHVEAESSLLLGQHADAEKLYQALLAKAPNDQDAEIWKVHLGTALYLQRKYQEAIDSLSPVVADIKSPDLLAEAWYRIGRSQAALRQFDKAITSLESSVAAGPKWKLADDAHLVLAYAYQQQRDLAKAQEHAKKVIADFPNSQLLDMAHYRLGECARLDNQLPTAVKEYELVLTNWPETQLLKQTNYGLGWAQLGQQKYAEAEKAFSSLIEKFPDDSLAVRARYGRGTARRMLKQYTPAIEDLEAYLATNPAKDEASRALHVLGLCQKGANENADAAATFNKLLAADPDYGDADSVYFELGWALKNAKKEAEAADAFGKLVEKFPESTLLADAQYLIGDYNYDKKDYTAAAKAYYAAMIKAGETKLGEEAAYKLGLAYYSLDDTPKARQTFTYQRTTFPDGPLYSDAAFMEAECSFKEKDYEAALKAYEEIKKASSKQVEELALLHSADAAAQLQQWPQALQKAEEFLQKFPNSDYLSRGMYLKGWALQNQDKPDEALVVFQQVVDTANDESAARSQFMIGEIQFTKKQHNDAIISFMKVSGFPYPKLKADALFEAARCFEVLKKVPQAVNLYQRIIKEVPDSDKVPTAKERVAALSKAG